MRKQFNKFLNHLNEIDEIIVMEVFVTLNIFIRTIVYGDLTKELDDIDPDEMVLIRKVTSVEPFYFPEMLRSVVEVLWGYQSTDI